MIETRGLGYCYAGGVLLRFADLSLPQGGTLLVGGPSGAGKSTWLALVAGLLLPAQGQICVAGQPLEYLHGPARDTWRGRHIGFLPQRLHLSPLLSVARNLALAQFAAGMPDDAQAVVQALQALQVQDLAPRMPSQLSGGQALRVALARAVLLQPQVILADEPTASLDDQSCQAALQLLLDTAQRRGASLVIATHDRRVEQHLTTRARAIPGLQRLHIAQESA